MRKILYPHVVFYNCYGYNVKLAVSAAECAPLAAFEKSTRSLDYLRLFSSVHIFLRWRLYAFPAGLYLYKMYSIRADGNNIYLKMSGPPVPFDDGMTDLCQISAGQFLSNLP